MTQQQEHTPLMTADEIGDIAVAIDEDHDYLKRTGDTLVIGMMVVAMNRVKAKYAPALAAANARVAELEAELATLRRGQWTPLADGEYGTGDTIKVSRNGEMLEINSAYGDGRRKHQAMIPLPSRIRLAAQEKERGE